MTYANLVPVKGTITDITRGNDCCSQMLSVNTENGIVNFIVNADTVVIDSRQLRTGMEVTAFYDSTLPVPLIYPPQYRAQLITARMRDEQVLMAEFDRNLVARDGSLQLNIARNTVIKTINGQTFDCSPGNQTLLVYYTATTRSIPPQTSPRKIVVLCTS